MVGLPFELSLNELNLIGMFHKLFYPKLVFSAPIEI